MSIIRELPDILREAETRNTTMEPQSFSLSELWQEGVGAWEHKADQPVDDIAVCSPAHEDVSDPACSRVNHKLYQGDNLRLMQTLLEQGMEGHIQMIYMDPPFFTRSEFDAVVEVAGQRIRHPAYEDTWTAGLREYLVRLARTLLLARELLSEEGLLWLHLDWHAVHYARILLDEVFGAERFVNEVIWEYKSGGSTRKRFARKHDNILVYSKGRSYRFHPLKEKSYNRGLKPYRFKGVEEFCDDVGWYTLVNMKDVWQIDMVGRTAGERTGYATQKPEKLLERILSCCTDPGDLVADFFCGSGTLGAVAARMGRSSIQCDRESLAVETSLDRITAEGKVASLFKEGERNAKPAFRPFCRMIEKAERWEIILQALREFRPPEGLDKASVQVLEEALANDPLCAIRSWSVDPAYDGQVFRPVHGIYRDRKGLSPCCEMEDPPGKVCVKVVDVMGRVVYYQECI